jgi:hypothetical protein
MDDGRRSPVAAGQAQQRRINARQAIYDRRKAQLVREQQEKLPPPSVPVGAPDVLRALYEAAREVWQQLQDSPDDWSEGWADYVERLGATIRAKHITDPLVQAYLEGLRTFGDKRALDRYKNVVGRLSGGVSPMWSHVDVWIAFHAAPMREKGASVAKVRGRLLKLLPQHPLSEGMPTDVEHLAESLLAQKLALHAELAGDPKQRLLAEMAAIGWLWQSEIRQRLGTDQNLYQQLFSLGIEVIPDDGTESCKETCPDQPR